MKKQLIAVGLAGLLAIPAVSFGAGNGWARPVRLIQDRSTLLVQAIPMLLT